MSKGKKQRRRYKADSREPKLLIYTDLRGTNIIPVVDEIRKNGNVLCPLKGVSFISTKREIEEGHCLRAVQEAIRRIPERTLLAAQRGGVGTMLELTTDNTLDFARARGWIGPGPATVEALGGGVSNAVLRVQAGEYTLILKQSRPQLRTRDAWFSDLDRVYREQEVMEALHPLLPSGVVPKVLHADRSNYVFAMSSAPAEARNWKLQLLAGDVDLDLGERIGTVLGRLHQTTAANVAAFERFRERTVFGQLRVEPFYRRVQERRPEVAAVVAPLIDRLWDSAEALCHGDYSPKNILTHERTFTLVDYETAHLGDPTMDLGFCASHLILKAVKVAAARDRLLELVRRFWNGYGNEAKFRPLPELEVRGVAHCGVCLLARVDGTSPVDYLTEEEQRESVRRLGRLILLGGVRTWHEVLAAVPSLLTASVTVPVSTCES